MVSFADYYNVISIDRLPSKTKTGKDSSKRFMKIGLPWKSEFSSAAKTPLLLKAHKKKTLQHVTGGNTSNTVLKRLL